MSTASLPATADPSPGPHHVAIIMDGNGRWAKARGLPRVAGHRRGADAVRRVVRGAGELAPERIDEGLFERELLTAGVPDPDLLIRTSGEQRISNFLLWQCAYAELVFVDTLWPDFGKDHLEQAIAEFRRRERRYGGVGG